MRLLAPTMLLALVVPVSASAVAPPGDFDDSHLVVFLHPERPYRLRLHVRVAGRSFQRDWARQVDRLFAHLDFDGDGRLSKAEGGLAPSRDQWGQLSSGQATDPDAAPEFAEMARGGKFATVADLRAYYQTATGGPMRVGVAQRLDKDDPLSTKLFALLDKDRNGKLSLAELKAAPEVCSRLDRNDDEMLNPAELMNVPFFYTALSVSEGPAHGPAPGDLPFVSVRPGSPLASIVAALKARYPDEKALRASGLRSLGKADVSRWLASPDVVLRLDLDRPERGVLLEGKRAPVEATATGALLRLKGQAIEVRVGPPSREPVRKASPRPNVFRELDADNNGFLDAKELTRPPFRYVSWLRLADRDGDGKISVKEATSFQTLAGDLIGALTSLRFEDHGRSLFDWCDTDGDRRLSVRELRNAARLAALFGNKGYLAIDDLPRCYSIEVAHGVEANAPEGVPAPKRPARTRGPAWFRKMDRNGDGDVSRAEWLGSREDFDRIDADGDGLLGADEAERADAVLRKK